MRWEDGRESSNVEDARGSSIGGRGASIGCGGLIVVLLISWLTGVSPLRILSMIQGTDSAPSAQTQMQGRPGQAPGRGGPDATAPGPAPADKLGKFASVVLASTEDVWTKIFTASGRTYQDPTLVLFSGGIRSACGLTSAAVGPFYCPNDRKVYLDTSFFRELSQRFGAPGDFADAYVVAHEVGHHVQRLLGTFDRQDPSNKQTSVKIELQADCYAGVWGNHANREQKLIEPGDFEAGLKAASAIGDDRLQRMSQGYVAPDSFTHGSSTDRAGWLRRGLDSGDPGRCDTFHDRLQ